MIITYSYKLINQLTQEIITISSHTDNLTHDVTQLKIDLPIQADQIDALEADVTTNTANIAVNTANIAINANSITTINTALSTQSSQIDTVVTNVATNTANIATNTNSISSQTTKFTNLDTMLTAAGPAVCADTNPCTTDSLNTDTYTCSHTNKAVGTFCSTDTWHTCNSAASCKLSVNLRSNYKSITFTADAAAPRIGIATAAIGKFNGDNYDDLIISSPAYSSNTGRVYIIFGNGAPKPFNLASIPTAAGTSSSLGIAITGSATGSSTGLSATGIGGSFNGDSYSDIIIGVPNANRAFIVYGSANPTSIVLPTTSTNGILLSTPAGSYTGVVVSGAGDFNGDGNVDVMVGAYTSVYKIYLVYGYALGATIPSSIDLTALTTSQGITITGTTNPYGVTGLYTGILTLGLVGDLNRDGKKDIIIGCNTGDYLGKVFVVFGTASTSPIALTSLGSGGMTITGTSTTNSVDFPGAVSAADVNGDGTPDLIIGDPNYNSDGGQAFVVFGASSNIPQTFSLDSLTSTTGRRLYTDLSSGSPSTGACLSSIGDFNKDGVEDIIIGGYREAYIVLGNSTFTQPLNFNTATSRDFILATTTIARSAWGVAGKFDFNNDGYYDVLISAGGGTQGEAYLLLGSSITAD